MEAGSLSKGLHRVYQGAIRRYREWARVSNLMKGVPSWPMSKANGIGLIFNLLMKREEVLPD